MGSRCVCGGTSAGSFVESGDGISVTGTGASGSPYVIAADPPAAVASLTLIVQDPASVVVTGDGQMFYTVPASLAGFTITSVNSSVPGAVSSSGAPTIQLARVRAGTPVDVLSTKSTIDATESSSYTAAIPSVVNTSNDDLTTGDFLRVDVDVAGTGAKGLQVIIGLLGPP